MIETNSVFGTRNVYEGYATEAIRFTWCMNYVLRVLLSNSRSDCVCLVWETGQCVVGGAASKRRQHKSRSVVLEGIPPELLTSL